MVLVSKANKRAILEYLFKEGVLACKKDGLKAKHDEIDVPNLHVMMIMKSMKDQGLVEMKFNWRWFYYFLNNEGIEALRNQLNLSATAVPLTLKKQQKLRQQFASGEGGGSYEGGKSGGWGKGGKGKGKGKGGWGKGGKAPAYEKEDGDKEE